jgi:hypothetical protein
VRRRAKQKEAVMQEPRATSNALKAATQLRGLIKTHIGKAGGNLNERALGYVDTLETVAEQIPHLQNMVQAIQQQAQVATFAFRNLERALAERNPDSHNGESESSETKGQ